MKKYRKIVLFACLLIIGAIFVWNAKAEHAYAAEPTKVNDYLVKEYSDITEYRQKDDLKIPVAYDDNATESNKWLFAGWYTNESCTSALGSGSVCTGNKTMKGTYYAKFVSADVLSVKCQITKDTLSTSDSTKLRCVSSVDSLKYKKIGFELITPSATKYMESSKVGTKINATDSSNDYSYSPKVVDTESEYFFSAIETIDQENFDKGYIVQPYWITKDGTKVYGVNKYVTVMEGVTDKTPTTIHVPVKMNAEPTGALTVTGGDATAVSCVEYKDGYAHFTITVANRRELKSATKFVIKEDGAEIASYIYRNLSSQYDGTDAKKDDTWYSIYSEADLSEDEFVIATSADLYGFAKAVTSSNKFDKKTVYLVNDIEANKGYANKTSLTWDKTLEADGETSITNPQEPYTWTAIGSTSNAFNGVFDGQMHTISGLYLSTASSYQGMFAATNNDAVIKNLYLKNSYFKSTSSTAKQLGSIVGNSKGTFMGIYSDAIMLGGGNHIGGILGSTSTNGSVNMSNCWFAGSVVSNDAASYFGGVLGRVANSTTITNCLNTGKVTVNANPSTEAAGGIIGGIEVGSATIKNCVNTSEITTTDSAAFRGLLVGYLKDGCTVEIENSHAYNQSDLTAFVYKESSPTYISTCGRYSLTQVAGLNALSQTKISKLFTADTAKGYWSITKAGFPVLTAFEKGSNVISQSVDTSWYDESKDEYILKDSGDLYGFALLSQTNPFDNKLIKLGADIEVNEGKALESGWDKSQSVDGKSITNGTDFLWMPIGTTSKLFNGEFDGQMHTISGIYLDATTSNQGLFSVTGDDAELKNFYLKNCYFKSTGASKIGNLGSVVGSARGSDFEKIYSDAIVAGYGMCNQVGGMIGIVETANVSVSDCWFAGSATINGAASYLGGLIGSVESDSTITNSLNTGEIYHKYKVTTAGAGGLVGYANADVSIINGVNHSNVKYTSGSSYIGLFVGKKTGTVTVTNSHTIDYSKYLVDTNYTYDGCLRSTAVNVAGLKSLTTDGVKELFFSDTAKGHWSITKDSLPVLSIFEKGSNVTAQAVDTSWYDASKTEYTLMDSGDLYGLALLSKTITFKDIDFKLGADITVNKDIENPDFEWMSICPSSSCTFQGDFDGQMHTISGLYQNSANQLQGLFGDVLGGEISNLVIENSYFNYNGTKNDAFIGALAGRATGSIKNVFVNTTVNSSAKRTAGLVGATTTSGSNISLTLINCWNAGSITSKAQATAGLIGYVDKPVTIKNCLNSGSISTSYETSAEKYLGGLIGWIDNTGVDVKLYNCLNTGTVDVIGESPSQYGMFIGNATARTTFNTVYTSKQEDTPAYYYNNNAQSRNDLKFDANTIKGTDALNTVKNLFTLQTTDGKYESYWSVVPNGTPVLTSFAKYAGGKHMAIDTSWYDPAKSGYELKDAADLYGLAVLSYKTDLNGFAGKTITLGADITLNKDMTAPDFEWLCIGGIGSPTPAFAGTFDGQMHTIKGLYVNSTSDYVGLFSGTASTAKIKNLQLVDSKLVTTGSYIGSVAGYGVGEFKNIYSEANVENGKRYIGGLVGAISGGNAQLEKCWFAGTVKSTNVGGTVNNVGAGGLIGAVNNSIAGELTLLNCLNSGTVDVSAYVNHVAPCAGGLIGWIQNQTDVEMDGCLVSGTMIGNNKITHSFGPIAGSVTLENTDGTQSSLSISRTYAVNDISQKDSTRVEEDSFVYVDKNEIIGDVAKDKMPLLFNSSDWKCVEGEYPILDFSTEQEKEDLTATNNDETQLSALYAGRQLYQGEMHNHAYTYGNGQGAGNPGDDGEVTLAAWKEQMLTYGLDFAASLDHNQSDHINHTEWKTSKFVYGTELGATITDDAGTTTIGTLHMDMIFKTKQQLDDFISAHPSNFELSGGYFYGGTFTKTEFKTFIKDVIQAGGFFNLPHPLQNDEYTSKDMNDYYFEVLDESQKQLVYGMHVITYSYNPENSSASLVNYDMWVQMLSKGYRVYATAGSDNHDDLHANTLTSIYATTCKAEKCTGDCENTNCTGYDKGNMIPSLQQGDFVAGSAGVKMSVGTTAMGGTCDFTNQRVVVDVEKIHTIANDLSDKYRIDVINENGVVYSKKLTLDSNGVAEGIELAFNADEDSKFYRVVVYNATTRTRIAIGNPIWNASK